MDMVCLMASRAVACSGVMDASLAIAPFRELSGCPDVQSVDSSTTRQAVLPVADSLSGSPQDRAEKKRRRCRISTSSESGQGPTMDGSASAAKAIVRSGYGRRAAEAPKKQQGVLGDRQVSEPSEEMLGLPLRKSRKAGGIAGDTGERTSPRVRPTAAMGPAVLGTDIHARLSGEERADEPMAASVSAPQFTCTAGGFSTGRRHVESVAQFLAPPDLQPTVLTNAGGVTLFRGLRHGILIAEGLDLPLLRRLPDHQLISLFEHVSPWLRELDPSVRQAEIEQRIERVRATDPDTGKIHAQHLRLRASSYMAREVAVAALAADPEKRRLALRGMSVDLHLCAVSLLKPDEFKFAGPQVGHFHKAARLHRSERLCLHDSNGELRQVPRHLRGQQRWTPAAARPPRSFIAAAVRPTANALAGVRRYRITLISVSRRN